MKSHEENRKYILRLWVPAIAIGGLFIVALISTLVSGPAAEIFPIVIAVVVTAGFILFLRWQQGFRLRRMLRSADPERVLRSMTRQLERVPHGRLFGAANRASVLALYGRFADAESALDSVTYRNELRAMQAFLRDRVPYCTPILERVDATRG